MKSRQHLKQPFTIDEIDDAFKYADSDYHFEADQPNPSESLLRRLHITRTALQRWRMQRISAELNKGKKKIRAGGYVWSVPIKPKQLGGKERTET